MINSAHPSDKAMNQTTEAKDKTDELIAEFMGYSVYDYELFGNMVRVYSPKTGDSVQRALSMHHVNQLKYNESWDWLMPVVEKIEAMPLTLVNIYSDATKIWVDDADQTELFGFTSHGNKDNKIGHVYRAVVEYIKWWNDTHSE